MIEGGFTEFEVTRVCTAGHNHVYLNDNVRKYNLVNRNSKDSSKHLREVAPQSIMSRLNDYKQKTSCHLTAAVNCCWL